MRFHLSPDLVKVSVVDITVDQEDHGTRDGSSDAHLSLFSDADAFTE
jgi:hypothetical protein